MRCQIFPTVALAVAVFHGGTLLGAAAADPQGPAPSHQPAPPAPAVQGTGRTPSPALPAPASVVPPAPAVVVASDYTIGPDDILSVVFWRDKDMSADVVVRPDGRITLPLVSDIVAAGLTPEQLRDRIREEASKYVESPSVTVVVKQINSRKVFITGLVGKPGAYPLSGSVTVLQMLSMAGGVNTFADDKKIMVMRTENGKQRAYPFNLREVMKGRGLQQNILLKPGDTIVVP